VILGHFDRGEPKRYKKHGINQLDNRRNEECVQDFL